MARPQLLLLRRRRSTRTRTRTRTMTMMILPLCLLVLPVAVRRYLNMASSLRGSWRINGGGLGGASPVSRVVVVAEDYFNYAPIGGDESNRSSTNGPVDGHVTFTVPKAHSRNHSIDGGTVGDESTVNESDVSGGDGGPAGIFAPPGRLILQPIRATIAPESVNITQSNIIWSKNWHRLVRRCPTVPPSYYSDSTQSVRSSDELRSYFANCTGTLWIRLGTHKKHRGDVPTFIKHVLPVMTRPFRLITTDGDGSAPSGMGWARRLLDHPLCRAWYTQNYDLGGGGIDAWGSDAMRKIRPIPIGLDLHTRRPGTWWSDDVGENVRRMVEMRIEALAVHGGGGGGEGRSSNGNVMQMMASLPFLPPWRNTNRERLNVVSDLEAVCGEGRHYERFRGEGPVEVNDLWGMYSRRRFGLSPRGTGWDCHRTWEMLFFGMIPVVKSGPLNALYDGLPVVIVQNWTEVCGEGFLARETAKFSTLHLPDAALTLEYWVPPEEDASFVLKVREGPNATAADAAADTSDAPAPPPLRGGRGGGSEFRADPNFRIVLVGNNYEQQFPLLGYGGIEAHVEAMAEGLLKIGANFTAIVPKITQGKNQSRKYSFPIYETDAGPGTGAEAFITEARVLIDGMRPRPDLILSVSDWSAARLQATGIPQIVTHGDSGPPRRLNRKLGNNVLHRFVSRNQRERWCAHTRHSDWLANRSFALWEGFKEVEFALREEKAPKTMLFVGTLEGKRKGIEDLEKLAGWNPDWKFVVYGTSKRYRPPHGNVEFRGELRRGPTHREAFQNATAFFMSVKWEEAFGRTVVEALSKGTPVFGSARGSIPELVPSFAGVVSDDLEVLSGKLRNYSYPARPIFEWAKAKFNAVEEAKELYLRGMKLRDEILRMQS